MKIEKATLSTIQQQIQKEFTFNYSLNLKFTDYIIKVNTNSENLYNELKKYFRIFISEKNEIDEIYAVETDDIRISEEIFFIGNNRGAKRGIKEESFNLNNRRIIHKIRTGMFFVTGENFNLAIGPCEANPNQIVNFVNNRFIEYKLNRGSLLFHAAGVSYNGLGFAIVGTAGAGKSTISLHMMRSGLTFISNDRLMIEKTNDGLMMTGIAKYPRINPGTIISIDQLHKILTPKRKKELLKIPIRDLWDLEEKYDLYIEDVYGENKFELTADLKALIILNWDRNSNASTQINQVDISERPDLFDTFMKSPGLFFQPTDNTQNEPTNQDYINLLSNCNVYEVSGGISFSETADFFSDLLKKQLT